MNRPRHAGLEAQNKCAEIKLRAERGLPPGKWTYGNASDSKEKRMPLVDTAIPNGWPICA